MVLMVIWIVSKKGMLAQAVQACLKNKKIKYIATSKEIVDILDIFQIRDFVNKNHITHIINCAAYTNVERAEIEKDLAFAVNVTGVENLANVAKDINAKLIHFSTDYVFDGKNNKPYLETDLCKPINYYGYTKCLSEEAIENILSEYLIIRTSWLFGLKKVNFPSKMFSLMQTNTSLTVINDQIGRATFCEDLAEATLNLLDQNGVFNFANEGVISWYDYALEIFKNLKNKAVKLKCVEIKPVSSGQFKTVAQRPKYSVLSTSKFAALNKPTIRSFSECLKYYLSQEYGIY